MPRTAARIVGTAGADAVWGIESDYRSLQSGLVVSVTRKSTGEKDTILDYEGFVAAAIYFDDREEIELEVICKAGSSPTAAPVRGTTLTVGAYKFLVDGSDLAWERRGWKKLKTQATYHPNVELPA
jgi:hypothetical protein